MSHPHTLLQMQQKSRDWTNIKDRIFTHLYETIIDTAFKQSWLAVSALFSNEYGTLPDGMSQQAFSSAILGNKANTREPGNGIFVHIHTLTRNQWGIVRRYKFECTTCLRVQSGIWGGVERSHHCHRRHDGKCDIVDIESGQMDKVRHKLEQVLADINVGVPSPVRHVSDKAASDESNSQRSRSDMALDSIMLSKSPFYTFNNLNRKMQSCVIAKLLHFYEDKNTNDVESNKELTAHNLVNFFKESGRSF